MHIDMKGRGLTRGRKDKGDLLAWMETWDAGGRYLIFGI